MISEKEFVRFSKFLSLVLRHRPELIGLRLDAQGWANVDELIEKAATAGRVTGLDRATLLAIVSGSDKQRFALSSDGLRIRASQGHSVSVDLQLSPKSPPAQLYHGTASRYLKAIFKTGLKPQRRQYVHLSADPETATAVGTRHGFPAVLIVDASRMAQDGFTFYQADNGVWLTEQVPVRYLSRH